MRLGLVVMALCWVFVIPPNAGPDEPAHLARSAAVVRGRTSEVAVDDFPTLVRVDVPSWIGRPDPGCYAFQPLVPASCLDEVDDGATGTESIPIARSEYPVWGRLVPGLGTLLPRPVGATWAPRLTGLALAIALLMAAWSASSSAGDLARAGVLLAMTPMAWFSIAVVNPSGFVIAGSIALWAGLCAVERSWLRCRSTDPPSERHGGVWPAVVGWAAVVLPRRDGIVWASLIVATFVVIGPIGPADLWRLCRFRHRLVIVASSALAVIWLATSGSNSNRLLVVAPVTIAFAAQLKQVAKRSNAWLTACVAGVIVSVPVLVAVAGVVRPSGYDRRLLGLIVNETGNNLIEAIGVLGWLDTGIPALALWGWCATLGILVAVAARQDHMINLARAGVVMVLGVVTPWLIELSLEQYYGTYWQGRYTLPLLAGVGILLSRSGGEEPGSIHPRLATVVAVAALAVSNAALLAAARRWGVGVAGSWAPWDWDTGLSVLPIPLLVAIHLGASIGVASAFWRAGGEPYAGARNPSGVDPLSSVASLDGARP